MVTTKKSDFLEKLEKLIQPESVVRTVSEKDTFVSDGMAIIQMLQAPASVAKPMYNDMASLFWKYSLSASGGVQNIHVVFDRYIENSLKLQTREKRGEDLSRSTPAHIQGKMNIPDWESSLASSRFKRELTHLYTKHLTENCHELLSDSQHVYVSGGFDDKALKVSSDLVEFVEKLRSNHEEADTHILLHVAYQASLGAKRAVVASPDTDVLVLLVHHFRSIGIEEIFFKTGRKSMHSDLTRFIPVHAIVSQLNEEQLHILLDVYGLTGCDTCSAFFGIGKKKAFKILLNNHGDLQGLSDLGNDSSVSAVAWMACVSFVGLLYGFRGCLSLSKLQVKRMLENKKVKPRKLPPTDDSLRLHVLRCCYQLMIWKRALTSLVDLPSPTEYGYITDADTGLYMPQIVGQPLAPPELLNNLVCCCEDQCSDVCVCATNEQPCTQACSCAQAEYNCENVFSILSSITPEDIVD